MDFKEILANKSLKAKEQTEKLSLWVAENTDKTLDIIAFAKTAKDPLKATCIEAFELATKTKPEISSLSLLDFVSHTLSEKAPRVKWESARVVGNIAHLYPKQLDMAIKNLLINTEHVGTVVRWSAAFALGEILKLKTPENKELIPAIENICDREEKNSIKKIYLAALKKAKNETSKK